MKKIVWLSVVVTALLIALLALGTVSASAKEYYSDYYTYTIVDGQVTITDVNESISGNVAIPTTLGGYPVTCIGDMAFYHCSGLTSITIPDSVTSIGNYAFSNCTGLTSITILDSVTSIGSYAFYDCDSLTSITIPDSVTSIGDMAFAGGSSLTSITIPSSVMHIGKGLFKTDSMDGENSLKEIIVDAQNPVYYSVGNCIIERATGTLVLGCQNSVIPADGSVKCIGNYAFAGSSLKSIVIPDGVTSIGDGAFYGCGSLTSITIPDGVTSIGEEAFTMVFDLTSLSIPSSVTRFGVNAVMDCGLESITFNSPTTDIGEHGYVSIDTVYGYAGSTAEAFAKRAHATFISLGWYNMEYALNADGQSYTLTAYIGTDKELIVPLTTLGLPVTNFSLGVFESKNDIDFSNGAIVLPEDGFEEPVLIEQITFLSKTIEIYDSAETIPETAAICGYVNSTAHQYALKYGREFIHLPEIASANIALGSDITVNYLAYLDDSQKDAVMKFTVGGVTATVQGVATATPNRYQFSFTGINPQMMGDNIAVELVLNGETLAEMGTYSVKQYCVNMKARVANKSITGFSDAQYAALDTLLADILEYGAAAQNYKGYNTGNLVNAGITGASEFIPLTSAHKMPAFNASTCPDDASFTSAKVVLSNAIQLRFEFKTTNVSRVTIKVGDRVYDKDDFTLEYSVSDGFGIVSEVHSLSSDAIFADQMETSYTVILCVDGVECQRLQYSVVNYIYNMQNSTSNPNLVELLKRIRNYGLSAVAYRDAK